MISLGSAYGEIQIGTEGAAQSVQSLASTLHDFGKTMSLAVSAPLIGAATVALKSAGAFEQSMNQLQAVSGATADQMAGLQSQALQLGADTSFSAGEAAQGMLELAKAGMSAKETGDAIGGVMSLAAAGNLDLAQAAEITANALNAFNLPAADSGRVADILAAAANSSSVEVTDMAQSFNMASAVFSSSGQSIDDLSTSIAILGNNGLKGSDAGTSLKTMMMRLTAPTKEAKKLMNELGINIYDAQGKTRAFPDILADLQQAMTGVNEVTVTSGGRTKEQTAQMKHYAAVIKQTQQKLLDYQTGVAGVAQSEDAKKVSIDRLNRTLAAAQAAYGELAGIQGTSSTVMKQMTEEERNQALAMIFGSDAVRAANILIREGTDEYGKMKDAVTEQGAAAQMADARMKGFNGAIEYIKGSIDSFLISTALPFLDNFGEIIRKVGDAITWFGKLPKPVKDSALGFLAILAAIGPVTLAISAFVSALAPLGVVLGVVTGPLGLLALAFGAMYLLNIGGVRDEINGFANELGGHVTGVLKTAKDAIDKFNTEYAKTGDVIGSAAQAIGQATGAKVEVKSTLPVVNADNEITVPAKAQVVSLDWTSALTGDGLKFKYDAEAGIASVDWTGLLGESDVGFSYDSAAGITKIDWNEDALKFNYDATAGITSVDFLGGLYFGHYTADASVTSVLWGTWTNVYDATAQISAQSLAWGAWSHTYDAKAQVSFSGMLWGAWTNTYDAMAKVSAQNLLWGAWTHTYDGLARIGQTDILWGGWTNTYDALAKVGEKSVLWGLWTNTYDAQGNLTSLTIAGKSPSEWWQSVASINIKAPDWVATLSSWGWPAFPLWAWPLLPAWTWPAYLAFVWPAYADWVWSDYPSWSWPTLPSWKWPSLPSWTWPSIPAPDWLDALLNAVGLGGNAGGTSYAYGQRSAINERGRELISIPADQTILPPGSRVYTNGQSNRMMDADTGTGLTINFYGTTIQSDMDIHRLANKLGSLVRKQRP